jgi:thiol-disulfide isomerase/thioredoxin
MNREINIENSPLSLWKRKRNHFNSPLSLWERVRVRAVRLLALALLGCAAINGCLESSGEKMQPIDAAGLAQFIDQHPGKVVLIDFWATWCPPCVRLFPHTVELHKRWADRGLVVAAVSLDDPLDESVARRFLAKNGADFPNFISRFGASSQSAEDFDITGSSIPFLRIYDRQGKLIKTFGGDKPVDPIEIDQVVEEAINSGSGLVN